MSCFAPARAQGVALASCCYASLPPLCRLPPLPGGPTPDAMLAALKSCEREAALLWGEAAAACVGPSSAGVAVTPVPGTVLTLAGVWGAAACSCKAGAGIYMEPKSVWLPLSAPASLERPLSNGDASISACVPADSYRSLSRLLDRPAGAEPYLLVLLRTLPSCSELLGAAAEYDALFRGWEEAALPAGLCRIVSTEISAISTRMQSHSPRVVVIMNDITAMIHQSQCVGKASYALESKICRKRTVAE